MFKRFPLSSTTRELIRRTWYNNLTLAGIDGFDDGTIDVFEVLYRERVAWLIEAMITRSKQANTLWHCYDSGDQMQRAPYMFDVDINALYFATKNGSEFASSIYSDIIDVVERDDLGDEATTELIGAVMGNYLDAALPDGNEMVAIEKELSTDIFLYDIDLFIDNDDADLYIYLTKSYHMVNVTDECRES